MIHFTCKECKSPMQLKPTPTGPVLVCSNAAKHNGTHRVLAIHAA